MSVKHLIAIGFSLLLGCAARAEIRVAIISTDTSTQQAGDVLAASLSSVSNLVLLERAEIEKVLREQSLNAASKTNFMRLGEILRADGLVILQPVDFRETTNIGVRLTAVNSGAILDGAVFQLPLRDPEQWAKIVTARFTPLLPKLEVRREEAVAISLVNLHSAVNTTTSIQTEQSLSALLFHRLMLERDLFVLERRQIGKLSWEKNLDSAGPAFWNSAYLLEGVIDRDGVAPETITIHARISPPNEGAPINVEATGSRQRPREIVEKLTAQILAAVQRQPTKTVWNPDSEAQRFEEEATWAERWKNWKEVYVAADSAYALGRKTDSVMAMKIRALIEQSHTPKASVYNLDLWMSNPDGGGWMYDSIRNVGWNEQMPAPEVAATALESLELFYSHCFSTDTNHWRTNAAWLETGVNALRTAAEVLRHHYFYSWRAGHFDESLPELRRAARDVSRLLSDAGDFSVFPADPKKQPRLMLERTICLSAWLWEESPVQTIEVYRKMMASGAFGRVRISFFKNKPEMSEVVSPRAWRDPFWVGWTRSDREHGAALWQAFLAELQHGTNRTQRGDAALLKLYGAVFDDEISQAAKEFYDAVMDENHSRFSTEVDYSLPDAFGILLENLGKETLQRQRLITEWKTHSFAQIKHYLQTTKIHDVDRAGWPVADRAFSQEQARELLPVIADYKKRFPGGDWISAVEKHIQKSAGEPNDPFKELFSSTSYDPARLKQLFENREFTPEEALRLTQGLAEYGRRFGYPEEVRVALARLRGSIDKLKTTSPNTNMPVFKVTRYIEALSKSPDSPAVQNSHFENIIEREGRLFAAVPHYRNFPNQNTSAIVEIDPETGTLTELARDIPENIAKGTRYEVCKKQVFWIEDENTIGRSNNADEPPRFYKVDAPLEQANLAVASGRLFIVSKEFIAEFFPVDGSLKLLASVRRRPAANPLDAWNWPGNPIVECRADGVLLATFIQYNLVTTWAYDGENWSQLPELKTLSRETIRQVDVGEFLFFHSEFNGCSDRWITKDNRSELLLSDDLSKSPRWPMPFDYPLTPGQSFGRSALHHFDGTNLWIIKVAGDLVRGGNMTGFKQPSDQHLTLLWFDPLHEMPAVIPFWFESKTKEPVPELSSLGPCVKFTSKGLLFFKPQPARYDFSTTSGLWFVPWAALQNWVNVHCPGSKRIERQAEKNQNEETEAHHGRRLLLTFDSNQDGKLDGDEIVRLATISNLGVTSDRFRPQPFISREPNRLLNDFDRNGNKTLELEEVIAIYSAFTKPTPFPGLRRN